MTHRTFPGSRFPTPRPRALAVLIIALTTSAAAIALTPVSLVAQSERLVILVRHAEAAGEPRNDPPLTERGIERAQALAQALEGARIGAAIVSSLARTRLTAEAVTGPRDLIPTVADVSGGLEEHVQAVADAVRARPRGEAVLVVGHSNTVPMIVAALGGPELPDLCHWQFSRLFVLEMREDETANLIVGSYGEKDEAGEEC